MTYPLSRLGRHRRPRARDRRSLVIGLGPTQGRDRTSQDAEAQGPVACQGAVFASPGASGCLLWGVSEVARASSEILACWGAATR